MHHNHLPFVISSAESIHRDDLVNYLEYGFMSCSVQMKLASLFQRKRKNMKLLPSLWGLIGLFVLVSSTPRPQVSTVTISPTTTAPTVTFTVTASSVIPSNAPQFKDNSTLASAVLNTTNFVRQAFNASTLSWNQTLADFSSSYLWSMGPLNFTNGTQCNFSHSGGPYGENLALGCTDATGCVERCKQIAALLQRLCIRPGLPLPKSAF